VNTPCRRRLKISTDGRFERRRGSQSQKNRNFPKFFFGRKIDFQAPLAPFGAAPAACDERLLDVTGRGAARRHRKSTPG
jgi:hypothetical protein